MKLKGCPLDTEVTDEHRRIADEIKANGGTLTAGELAHSEIYDGRACAWTKRRAQTWVAREQAEGKWLDAHIHTDGRIYFPREAR